MDAAATVVGTAHGAALLATLRKAVSEAKADDPLAPVTVLAPDNIAGIAARRYLAQGVAGRRGVAGITVTTLPRLAEQLAGPALLGRRPISSAGLAATVRTVLADEPGVFDEVADNANTIEALCTAHRTLRDLGTRERSSSARSSPPPRRFPPRWSGCRDRSPKCSGTAGTTPPRC